MNEPTVISAEEQALVAKFKVTAGAYHAASEALTSYFMPLAYEARKAGRLDLIEDLSRRCPPDTIAHFFLWDCLRETKKDLGVA